MAASCRSLFTTDGLLNCNLHYNGSFPIRKVRNAVLTVLFFNLATGVTGDFFHQGEHVAHPALLQVAVVFEY